MAKPKFDPSKPFQTAMESGGSKPAFNPDQPFQTAPENPKPPVLETGVRNFVQGASANFSDELAGGVEAAGRALGFEGAGGPMRDIRRAEGGPTLDRAALSKAYETGRDRERADLARDMEARPGLATTANIAGAIVSPVNKVTKGMSLAKSGALIGGVASAGASDADNALGVAQDAATGVAGGAVLGKAFDKAAPFVGKGISKARASISKIGEKAKEAAEKVAFKASGAMLRDYRAADSRGMVSKLGRFLLDNGLKVGDSVDDVARKMEALNKAAGEHLDDIYTRAGSAFKEQIDKFGFDPVRDKGKIIAAAKRELGDTEGGSAAVARLSKYLDEVAERHGDLPNDLAKKAYQKEVAEYLPRLKNFMRHQKEYRAAIGRAADDLDQPVLSGMTDDLQRTGARNESIEVRGRPASRASVPNAIPSEDTFLSPLPQRHGYLFNQSRGDDLLSLNQKMALDNMSKGEIASLGRQAEIEGLKLVPRQYADVQTRVVAGPRGQTSMPIAPNRPARPVRPQEVRNPMSPRRANDVKGAMDDVINYSRNPLSKEPASEKAFSAARREMSKIVDETIESLGGDDLVNELKKANRDYGSSKQIAQLARDRSRRETANKMIGLTDTITGGAGVLYGGSTGDWETAAGIFMGKKLVEKYGVGVLAKSLDRVGRMLIQKPQMQEFAKSNPKAFQATVIEITRRLEREGAMPRAAKSELDQDSGTPARERVSPDGASAKPLKGRDKWASQGMQKVIEHVGDQGLVTQEDIQRDPKLKDLLARASDLKAGSRAMEGVVKQIKARMKRNS